MEDLSERKGESFVIIQNVTFFMCGSCKQRRPDCLRPFLDLCVVTFFYKICQRLCSLTRNICKQVLVFQKLTLLLAFTTLISAFGSSFQYGYNVAVINSPAPVLVLNLHIYSDCLLSLYTLCNPMRCKWTFRT